MRVDIIGHLKSCMTDLYLDIHARTADYIHTHPYTHPYGEVRGGEGAALVFLSSEWY